MMLSRLSPQQLEKTIEEACKEAILLLPFSIERQKILAYWEGVSTQRIHLKSLLHKKKYRESTRKIFKLLFIKSLLFDMLLCLQKTQQQFSFSILEVTSPSTCQKITIGLNGMQTEYISHDVTKKLKELLRNVEEINSLKNLSSFIVDLLLLPDTSLVVSPIETQLFYADMIYQNFDTIMNDRRNFYGEKNTLPQITLYTWVGGDQDGIPFTTRAHTEAVIEAFQKRIKENYAEDIARILKKYPQPELIELFQNFRDAMDPEFFLNGLQKYDATCYPEIAAFRLKLKAFGFHYMEIEFRENSRVIHDAIAEIITVTHIHQYLGVKKTYCDLSESERERILLGLINKSSEAQKLVKQFLQKNKKLFAKKSQEHHDKSIYDIQATDPEYLVKYNAKRFLEWFFLIQKNPTAINKFGIAEAQSVSDALAIVFFTKAILKEKTLHVVIQPEGPGGAKKLYHQIEALYQNKEYAKYLKKNGNIQYITFGPSDICKQGGKGMHVANMQLANMHREKAKKYGIQVITSIIIGHEHARSNHAISDILEEFGASKAGEVRYMLGGLNEMRHRLLSSVMVRNFFSQLYGSSLNKKKSNNHHKKYKYWMKAVESYEALFFKHATLPALLKTIARLDIIRRVTNDARPQSRHYWLEFAEENPSQIRAVAWVRSLLVAGLRFEWIGSHTWMEKVSGIDEQTSAHYIKSIAYACARTNFEISWRALESTRPTVATLRYLSQKKVINNFTAVKKMLAHLHLSFLKTVQGIYRVVYNQRVSLKECLENDRFSLLKEWPEIEQEVVLREKQLEPYYEMLATWKTKMWTQEKQVMLKDVYATFLNASNTAVTHFIK